jgi:hypothetical protein
MTEQPNKIGDERAKFSAGIGSTEVVGASGFHIGQFDVLI